MNAKLEIVELCMVEWRKEFYIFVKAKVEVRDDNGAPLVKMPTWPKMDMMKLDSSLYGFKIALCMLLWPFIMHGWPWMDY